MAANNSSQGVPTMDIWPLHDFRSCFYAMLPSETYHSVTEEVPPYLFRAVNPWGFLLILVEILTLKLTGKSKEWRLHSAVVSYSASAIFEGFHIFVLRDLELSAYQWTFDRLRMFTLPWDSLTTFVVTLVTMEFGAYWWHRMSHELAIMWASHEFHHSSDDFNLSIAFRNSATIRLFRWIFYLPLALLGVPTSIMLTHYALGSIFNGIIHHHAVPKIQKIVPGIGHVIDFVFVTPSHHRVHHASNKYCIDKNYGQYTILWDRLFGTFAEEREDEPLVYGSLTQPQSYDMANLQISSYVKLWQKFQSMENPGDKLRSLFFGPGWFPGTPRLGNHEDIPDVRGREKYNPQYSFVISSYLVINSFCIFYSYVDMSTRVQDLSALLTFLNLTYICVAYTAIGGLYDNREYASGLELVRLVTFLALSNVFPMLSQCIVSKFIHFIYYLNILSWPFIAKYNGNQSKDQSCYS